MLVCHVIKYVLYLLILEKGLAYLLLVSTVPTQTNWLLIEKYICIAVNLVTWTGRLAYLAHT